MPWGIFREGEKTKQRDKNPYCVICGEEFLSTRMLGDHYKAIHNKTPTRLMRFLLWTIDWVNHKSGIDMDNPKPKQSSEQMASIEDLFYGYEEEDKSLGVPSPRCNPGTGIMIK